MNALIYLKKIIKHILPFYYGYLRMQICGYPLSYAQYLLHIIGLKNRSLYWFCPKNCWTGMPKRIYIGKNSAIGRPGGYYQAFGGIYIGNHVRIAPRVTLLTSNHDIYNHKVTHHAPIKIGDYCWLGMNTSILAGVELGPRTIVATGAVVNKSFPEGYCILGGVPAKIVKKLDPTQFNKADYEREYYNFGYIPAEKVEENPQKFIDKYLDSEFFEVKNGEIVLRK